LFNPKPEAMAGGRIDRPHVTPAVATGFGLNEECVSSPTVQKKRWLSSTPATSNSAQSWKNLPDLQFVLVVLRVPIDGQALLFVKP